MCKRFHIPIPVSNIDSNMNQAHYLILSIVLPFRVYLDLFDIERNIKKSSKEWVKSDIFQSMKIQIVLANAKTL